jgi:hypothetical protein
MIRIISESLNSNGLRVRCRVRTSHTNIDPREEETFRETLEIKVTSISNGWEQINRVRTS